jgi:glycine/D-amino acid oxidase-like deaminating enzyme
MVLQETGDIVIVGGGIQGVSTAYFLSTHPQRSSSRRIILIEASSIAEGASGKAGGLLATWAFPACIVPLSFRLHAELANKFNGANNWGYRVLDGCWNITGKTDVEKGDEVREKRPVEPFTWFDRLKQFKAGEMVEKDDQTAQVHPRLFCETIINEAQKNGVEVIYGKVTSISSGSSVTGVKYLPKDTSNEIELPASTVIVTAGPWTKSLLKDAPIYGERAHSLVIRPKDPTPAHVAFTNISMPTSSRQRTVIQPEFYPRSDGTVYISGPTDESTLPELASQVQVDQTAVDTLKRNVFATSSILEHGGIEAEQACFLPMISSQRQGPILGSCRTQGLYIAAGHTCWGIQNGPGTGYLMAELIWDGMIKSANVEELDPKYWQL